MSSRYDFGSLRDALRPFVGQSLTDWFRTLVIPAVIWALAFAPFLMVDVLDRKWFVTVGAVIATAFAGRWVAREYREGRGGPMLSFFYMAALAPGLGWVADQFVSASVVAPTTFTNYSIRHGAQTFGVGTLVLVMVGFFVPLLFANVWLASLSRDEFEEWCGSHIHPSYAEEFRSMVGSSFEAARAEE